MTLFIHYPFDNLPMVVFENIRRVQDAGGTVIIYSNDFGDIEKLEAAKRWIIRMLTAHDRKEYTIFNKISWGSECACLTA